VGATAKEAFMLNRATFIGAAVALAATLVVIVLVQLTIGPRASRADLASPSLSVDDLQRQVDASKLPVHAIPAP
jgi:hypothetical protein